jgi:hypothetical protein
MADVRRKFSMGRGGRTTAKSIYSKPMTARGASNAGERATNGAPRVQLWPTNITSSEGRDRIGYHSGVYGG